MTPIFYLIELFRSISYYALQPYNALEDVENIVMGYAELVMIPNELTDVHQTGAI